MNKTILTASCLVAFIVLACSSTHDEITKDEPVLSTDEALTSHLGYCATDASGDLTGNCIFPNSCGGGGACHSKASSACTVGKHVTDVTQIPCNTCPLVTTNASQNTRCTIVF